MIAHGGHEGVGVGVSDGQLRLFGENVIGMVLFPSRVTEPEKVLVPALSGPHSYMMQVLKIPFLRGIKGIELLTVIGVPDDGVTVIE